MNWHFRTAVAVLALATPGTVQARTCTPPEPQAVSAALADEIARQNAAMAAAWIDENADELTRHLVPDSLLMPDYQERLSGPEQARAYYRALFSRLRVDDYSETRADVLPLENGALEWGTFTLAYAPTAGGDAENVEGRYVHLWRRQPDGTLGLKAQAWGFRRALGASAAHWLVDAPAAAPEASPAHPELKAELAALNAATGESVRLHTTARIDQYAEDAVFLPYADEPQVGLPAIRAHLVPYIERGRGATFDSVRVGNDGFEKIGEYVAEYSNFEVRWRAGETSGLTSGDGLRLWRREADCSLKIVREAGTHHRP